MSIAIARDTALSVSHQDFGYIASAGCVTEDPMIYVVLTNQRSVHSHNLAVPLVMAALSD